MSLRSAIYVGHIRHRRRQPAHAFTFPLFMVYLDLAELDTVFSMTRLWGRSRLCPARFRREDYLSRGGMSLDESVRACVHEQLGFRPCGPIRMLTHLRYFGFVFNPVTFYYCFDQSDNLEAVVAEITNTPWRERHAYALDARSADDLEAQARSRRWRFDKRFHVSPFFPMDLKYGWGFSLPGRRLAVQMNLIDPRRDRAFEATLLLHHRAITPMRLRVLLLRYPFMTAQVIAKIHVEALRLWLKRARVFPHPGGRSNHPTASPVPRSTP